MYPAKSNTGSLCPTLPLRMTSKPKTFAMERCLAIPEMILEIFSHLAFSEIWEGDIGSDLGADELKCIEALGYLARTCRKFHEPACSVLWRYIPSMLLLFELLPADKCEIKRENGPGDADGLSAHFKISKDLTLDDFKRVQYYAPFVRYMGHGLSVGLNDAFLFLQSHFHQQLHLPNLQGLCIDNQELSIENWIKFINDGGHDASKILSLFFTCFEPTHAKKALDMLGPYSRYLKHFDISCENIMMEDENPSIDSALARLAANFSDLTCFKADPWTDIQAELLLHLSKLQRLEKLELALTFPDSEDFVGLRATTDPKGIDISFPSLSIIVLFAALPTCFMFFSAINSPKLQELYISGLEDYTVEDDGVRDLHELFELLRSTVKCVDSLRVLCLSSLIDDESEETPRCYVDAQSMTPLFRFRNMSELVISSCYSSQLNNVVLAKMGMSWPRIKTVAIVDRFSRDAPLVTLEGVQNLITSSAGLESFHIRFDARRIPQSQFVMRGFVPKYRGIRPPPRLQYLGVSTSPIKDSGGVARFLMLRCPSLRILEHSFYPELDHELQGQRWAKVGDIIHAARTTRVIRGRGERTQAVRRRSSV